MAAPNDEPGSLEMDDFKQTVSHEQRHSSSAASGMPVNRQSTQAHILSLKTPDLMRDVEQMIVEYGLSQTDRLLLTKGAVIARYGIGIDNNPPLLPERKEEMEAVLMRECSDITPDEIEVFYYTSLHKWKSQKYTLFLLAAICAASAIVQGMDQSAVNGAQEFYFAEFQVHGTFLRGFTNGAPYLFASAIGCWLTSWINGMLGRRGCIAVCCTITALASIMQAASPSLPVLIVARAILGVGIGAKSTTTPVFASECAPTSIRGALTMMWQMWTAFGVMLGFVSSLAFQHVKVSYLPGLNWRLMLGVNAVFPTLVAFLVWNVPESPRWYMQKRDYIKAFASLKKLRTADIVAARDFYSIHKGLQLERPKGSVLDIFRTTRNRHAALSAFFVMFMQQFCGVNVVAYYSTEIFRNAGWSLQRALWASFGAGLCNWLFAIPAFKTIDTFGRRKLLLVSFPLMGACLILAGSAFYLVGQEVRVAVIATGLYLFMIFYSPGEGPVPFTYCAEAFPLWVRDWGMAFATSVCWGFNFVLATTWPSMVAKFTEPGAFYYYASWCFAATAYTYFLLQETKGRSLEELDIVFQQPLREHAGHYWQRLVQKWEMYIFRLDNPRTVRPLHAEFNVIEGGQQKTGDEESN